MVMLSAALMDREKVRWKFCGGVLLSRTRMVKLETPVVVGVPLMVPAASVSPAGRVPVMTDQLYGARPPAALRFWE